MRRPNLAGKPFENVRPVWLAGAVLSVAAVGFSVISITEALGARDSERMQTGRLQSLTTTRTQLVKSIDAANRELARVSWKTLQLEASSLQGVVARRELSWGALLVDLERVLPWNVRLMAISPTIMESGGIQITLRGVAATRESWLRLIEVFFADDRFSDPVPLSEESPGSSGVQGYAFGLRVMYWPGGRR